VYDTLTVQSIDGSASQQIKVGIAGQDEPLAGPTPDAYVISNYGSPYVLLGIRDANGDATLDSGAVQTLAPTSQWGMLAAGDLDGDGRMDIVQSTNNGAQTVTLTLNRDQNHDGTPEFMSVVLVGSSTLYEANDVAIADINMDGRLDIFLGTGKQDVIYLGLGDTNGDSIPDFSRTELPQQNSYSWGVAVGDMNGDGRPDLVAGGWGDSAYLATNLGDANEDGMPEFSYQELGTPGIFGSMSLGDLDGDGDLDILAPGWGNSGSRVYINNGDVNADGKLDFAEMSLGLTYATLDSDLADLDRDGDLDAVLYPSSGSVVVLMNRGDTDHDGLPELAPQSLSYSAYGLAGGSVGDIDGDGDIDLAVASAYSGLNVFTNRGDSNQDGYIEWGSVVVTAPPSMWDVVLVGF
jgi:hypothetical protein